jgi:hypothetical protein
LVAIWLTMQIDLRFSLPIQAHRHHTNISSETKRLGQKIGKESKMSIVREIKCSEQVCLELVFVGVGTACQL